MIDDDDLSTGPRTRWSWVCGPCLSVPPLARSQAMIYCQRCGRRRDADEYLFAFAASGDGHDGEDADP